MQSRLRFAAMLVSLATLPVPSISFAVTPIVAVHASSSSANGWHYRSWRSWHPSGFLREAFKADGTPNVSVTDADIEAGHLLVGDTPRYPIVFSFGNDCVSDATATALTAYVNAGGTVFTSGASFSRNADCTPRIANGAPTFALPLGLRNNGYWAPVNSVRRASAASDPFLDLQGVPTPALLGPLESMRWFFPRAFDVSVDRELRNGPHLIWSVSPATAGAAQTVLDANSESGFVEPLRVGMYTDDKEVLFADMNGDRRADRIDRDKTTGAISVSLSLGNEFAPPTTWGTWSPLYTLLLSDINGDGKADLVGRRIGGIDIVTWLSTGSSLGAIGYSSWSTDYDLHLADMDSDGRADILGRRISSGGPNTPMDVHVGLATGDPTTPFAMSSKWGTWPAHRELIIGDIDGDGKADLIGRDPGDFNINAILTTDAAFSAEWIVSSWRLAYDLVLGDVDGDGKADLIGRCLKHQIPRGCVEDSDITVVGDAETPGETDIQVALATNVSGVNGQFSASTSWNRWTLPFDRTAEGLPYPLAATIASPTFEPADFNGDGRADILATLDDQDFIWGAGGVAMVVMISSGRPVTTLPTDVVLARKSHGAGQFIYLAEMQPVVCYGADTSCQSTYRFVRRAIDVATSTPAARTPVARSSPWPYAYDAAFIYRHDHSLNMGIVETEAACGITGEYYILVGSTDGCVSAVFSDSDFPASFNAAQTLGAIFGAHTCVHEPADAYPEAHARDRIDTTLDLLQPIMGTRPTAFVAPGHEAIRRESMQAIADNNISTTGEQGFGPFPSFSVDPDPQAGIPWRAGRLLQLPVSGYIIWPGAGPSAQCPAFSVCNYPPATSPGVQCNNLPAHNKREVDMAYTVGGLINVYDHSGSEFQVNRHSYGLLAAQQAIDYAFRLDRTNIWKTSSGEIRNWMLQRNRKTIATTYTPGSRHVVTLAITTAPAIDTTTADENLYATRIQLPPDLLTAAMQNVAITLNGVASNDYRLSKGELYVRVGTASRVTITLGL